MRYPAGEEWAALDPVERFELASRLVIDARRFRAPPASGVGLSVSESSALALLGRALQDLGYEPAYPARFKWRRTT